MWSNAFYHTLDFAFDAPAGVVRRLAGARIRRLVGRLPGQWLIEIASGELVDVQLCHGWVCAGGRGAGLSWIAADGRRFNCILLCLKPECAPWRRLLVRLRVPT